MSTKSRRAGTATPQPQVQPQPQPVPQTQPQSQPQSQAGQQSQSQTQSQSQSGGTSTPIMSGPAMMTAPPGSPLSPTRHSRLLEKAELQNLNDRLACYIDRVRNLETENARLNIEVQMTRETITREATNIKTMYESELGDARRLLDETAREKAKLEIDIKRLWGENEELKSKLDKKTKECSIAEGNARMYETRVSDLQAKYNAAATDRKKLQDELNDLLQELDKIRKQLDEARKNLEDETLARVDLENSIQSLREELTFKDQIHMQEINETRSRRQVDISEIDGRLCEQYEAKLQQSLQELREQYEAQMRANRDEIEMLYETKIKNLQAQAHRNTSTAASVVEELRVSRSRIEGLNARIGELEQTNATLNARIRDLEQILDNERLRHAKELADNEAELKKLRDEFANHLQEYQDLLDTKVSLDLEIAAYDKLLCGEESRLNITPSRENIATVSSLSQSFRRGTPIRKTPSRASTSSGPFKRKRTMLDETEDISQSEYFVSSNAKGEIQIVEVDGDGKFVKLNNKGSKEVSIGGWQLTRLAGSNETAFKFHRSVKIEPGAIVTVWSSDAGVAHEPPANIVMKTQKWFVADNMKTVLMNGDGEEVASLDRVKRTVVQHASRHRTIGGRIGTTVVDGVKAGEAGGQEKCRIM